MKLYTRVTSLLLTLVMLSSAKASAQAEMIVGGAPLTNFTFVKIPMPKSNFSLAGCLKYNDGVNVPISPKESYDTVQITWDADNGDFGNVQSAGTEDIDGPCQDFLAIVCWIGAPFTLYVGTALLSNQTDLCNSTKRK